LYIKTWNKQDPLRAVTISILSLIVSCGYLIHLAERKHPLDCSDASGAFSSISNCMWLVIITISTVGYGDLSTVTVLGRLISLLTAFIGLMISATLIGIVQERLTLSDDEFKVIQVLEEENRMKQYQEQALQCVEAFLKIYVRKYRLVKKKVPYSYN